MRRLTRFLGALIVLALIAAAVVVFGHSCSTEAGKETPSLRTAATNALLDASGIKDRLDEILRNHIPELAQASGLSESILSQGVDALAIPQWTAIDKPASATATGTVNLEYQGTPFTVTTYDRNDIVGVSAYGQDLTFKVPPSAVSYISLFNYLV